MVNRWGCLEFTYRLPLYPGSLLPPIAGVPPRFPHPALLRPSLPFSPRVASRHWVPSVAPPSRDSPSAPVPFSTAALPHGLLRGLELRATPSPPVPGSDPALPPGLPHLAARLGLHPAPSSRAPPRGPPGRAPPWRRYRAPPSAPGPASPARFYVPGSPVPFSFGVPRWPSCRPILRCTPSRDPPCSPAGCPVPSRPGFIRALTPLSSRSPPPLRVPSGSITSPLSSRWSDGPVVVARGRFHTQCVHPWPLTVESAMSGIQVGL